MPDIAECTTTGRTPSARRSRRTCAMRCQFSTVDTLVPQNFSTTNGLALIGASLLLVVKKLVQFLFEPAVGKNVFKLAPGRFTALDVGGLGTPVRPIDQNAVEIGRFLVLREEFIVQLKVLVAFGHVGCPGVEG